MGALRTCVWEEILAYSRGCLYVRGASIFKGVPFPGFIVLSTLKTKAMETLKKPKILNYSSGDKYCSLIASYYAKLFPAYSFVISQPSVLLSDSIPP